jgi:hypothetical protein
MRISGAVRPHAAFKKSIIARMTSDAIMIRR